jgi:hypothetical protein
VASGLSGLYGDSVAEGGGVTGEMVLFVAAWLAVIVWVGLYLTRRRR